MTNNNKINRKSFFGKALCGIGALFGIKAVAKESGYSGMQSHSVPFGTTGASGETLVHGSRLNTNSYNFEINDIRDSNGKIIKIELKQENGLVFEVTGENINIFLSSNSTGEYFKPNIINWTSNTNSAPDFKSFNFDKEVFFIK